MNFDRDELYALIFLCLLLFSLNFTVLLINLVPIPNENDGASFLKKKFSLDFRPCTICSCVNRTPFDAVFQPPPYSSVSFTAYIFFCAICTSESLPSKSHSPNFITEFTVEFFRHDRNRCRSTAALRCRISHAT